MQPLDPELNAAILEMAHLLYPNGFDVSGDAPQTYEALCALLNAGGRMCVWSGAAERTIYADPIVNFAFRAWHDWCHVKGGYPFTPEGERAACFIQMEQLRSHFGPTLKVLRWCRIIYAEVIGQQTHYETYGRFPGDQRAFVEAFLENPLTLKAS